MKSLIVTAVSIFAVVLTTAAEGQNFPAEPGELDGSTEEVLTTAAEGQNFPVEPGELDGPTEEVKLIPDGTDFTNFIQHKEKIQHKGKGNKTSCKAKTTCIILGGSCVANATLCSGRLIEGCKGKNCQCCVPDMDSKLNNLISSIDSKFNNMNSSLVSISNKQGTVEAKITNLEEDFQSFKGKLNSTLHNIDSNIDSNIESNFNIMNSSIDSMLNYLYNISSSLVFITEQLTCPGGFVRSSNQCFKLFTDSTRTWSAARSKCRAEGLQLAKPSSPVELRKILEQTYAGGEPWIGGQGSGSSVKWDRDGSILSSSSSAWYPGEPGGRTSSSYCLILATLPSNLNSYPNQPYSMAPCAQSRYPLCELVVE